MIATWLVDSPLDSPESLLARVILTGLNWGTKSEVHVQLYMYVISVLCVGLCFCVRSFLYVCDRMNFLCRVELSDLNVISIDLYTFLKLQKHVTLVRKVTFV